MDDTNSAELSGTGKLSFDVPKAAGALILLALGYLIAVHRVFRPVISR